MYFVEETRGFRRKPPPGGNADRTFVQFVLEPLYKIFSQVSKELHDARLTIAWVSCTVLGPASTAHQVHTRHELACLSRHAPF